MLLRRALPIALALVGLLKAGALLWAGARLGLAPWMVATAAVAWALAPAAAAWVWQRRRSLASARGATSAAAAAAE